MMKQYFIISIALLLCSLSYAAEPPSHAPCMSESMSPMISPSSEISRNTSDCSPVIYEMVDCLSFIMESSTDEVPTSECCVGVHHVLKYNPNCFCSGVESAIDLGFKIDVYSALDIPSLCYPDFEFEPYQCDSVLFPDTPKDSPSTSPSPSPSSPPSKTLPTVTSSPPSKTLPTPTPSPQAATHSSPASSPSSPAVTASSPKMSAPAPSPSSTGKFMVSKLFIVAVLVSSFVFISA